MSEAQPTARNPWAALVLSLFSTGLGQVYAGHIVRGLILFLVFLLFVPIVFVAALLQPSTPILVGLLLVLGVELGIMLFSAVDAYRLARQSGAHYELKEFNRPLVYALFLLVGLFYPVAGLMALRANVFEAFYIPTESEVPNILPGDRILVNKLAYRDAVPKRGDIVVFRSPGNRSQNWIKRVIGLPGDTVEVRDNQVYVNGKKLERDPVPKVSLASIRKEATGDVFYETNAGSRYKIMLDASSGAANHPRTKVPEGCFFVLGDNRNHSEDSRHFGGVPMGDIIGTIQYIYIPALSWSRFGAYVD
jgi:signal peptidase I